MINIRYRRQVDQIINKVNSLDEDQLKKLDFEYIKCARKGKYLFINGVFDSVFLARLDEIYHSFSNIQFPSKVFRCYIVMIVDLSLNRFLWHRLYTFPINVDKFNLGRIHREFRDVMKQFEETPLSFTYKMEYEINSRYLDVTKPYTRTQSENYYIRGQLETKFDFDVDDYIKNHVTIVDTNHNESGMTITINDPYYSTIPINRQMIIDKIDCTCEENRGNLRFACIFELTGKHNKKLCDNHHTKKCKCGNWTYLRTDMCTKCHLTYSKSKSLDQMFNSGLFSTRGNALISYIPTLHYNQSGTGLCLGSGRDSLNYMLATDLNPIKMMLSFKANMSYTDNSETTLYYKKYKKRIRESTFSKYGEFLVYLNEVFRRVPRERRKSLSLHTLSLYCYCPQCFFVRIVMYQEKMEFDKEVFDNSEVHIISRDYFIYVYRNYMNVYRGKRFHKDYIYAIIKQVVNKKPIEYITA